MENICYWDDSEKCQKERPATQEELIEIEERRSEANFHDSMKPAIYSALEEIDKKSIRALREGNQERISALEQEAEALRQQLRKD